ncbi:DNA-directed RNA polymerase [Sphingomonas desiccabilis]|uniref:DNA-directed RNA polymerase n=1 Tax=Sphingomonas desiccabilis TaxID=429134 RepID=A0A4Q2IVQ2_9SPHN|nr:DNA-directed RNA polymerase [Sphingomonas desiccabilis]MBB3910113.1 DNA-directed RNA polymerase [Sphingomonas desiccabilis]RXZ34799.1 hypothetical protein EO081_03840 [Sphingomonas desiccabilis]
MHDHDTLVAAQRLMEANDLQEGANLFKAAQDKKAEKEGFDKRDEVAKLIRGALPLVSQGIAAWVEETKNKKGRPPAALAPLSTVDPDVVALGALSKTFATVAKGKALSATCCAIGRTVQVEVEARMIEAEDAKAAKRFLAMVETAGERKAAKRHEELAEQLGIGLEWSQRTQVLVGSTVLNVILTVLGEIFERGTVTDHRGTVPVVKFTERGIQQLSHMTEAAAWMQPILRPMIVQPRVWTHFDTGAYLEYRLSKTVPLVRTFNREHQMMVRTALKDGSAQELLDGVNAIQGTAFAIDRRVYDVMAWVRGENLRPSKSFPVSDPVEMPAKVSKEEWAILSMEARTAMSRKRKSIRNIQEASGINCGLFATDLQEAERLLAVPEFYLPHSLDFRGRVYAVPYFNPQRSDHVKALFRFAGTVPMGPEGGQWLAVHLANCGDFDKVSKEDFQTRLDWVYANEAAILEVAQDPKGTYAYWSTADSPFCFLQACFEWAEWAASGYSGDWEGCIGIALDGSCSGLQHYSAMTRSAEEGYHVNLLPREKPGDIYRTVADAARPTLEYQASDQWLAVQIDRAEGDKAKEDAAVLKNRAARIILDQGFGRSDVKRNVMTYFYGSGKFGMRDQHMVDTMRPLADEVALGERKEHPYAMLTTRKNKETGEETQALDGGFTCAASLAAHVYAAVVSVAPKADEAANWFQSVAATLAHESLPVVWRTPTGLPVMQKYSEYTSKRVNLWLYSRAVDVPTGAKLDSSGNVLSRIECLIREAPTKRIDKKKARSAISPNIVHSLDAAHLIRTVVFAYREGIRSFQLIHDSFATHAGNTGRFFQIIREAFVNLYETYDPFVELDRYARSVLSEEGQEKLPPIPSKGTLDLKQVLESAYAFA